MFESSGFCETLRETECVKGIEKSSQDDISLSLYYLLIVNTKSSLMIFFTCQMLALTCLSSY